MEVKWSAVFVLTKPAGVQPTIRLATECAAEFRR
jgi:hypothetical protein